ncbi:hypothetical protein ASE82_16935 [Sphingomonas sp. Leaf230]|nr:hypothetical protein ASE82_16935 [Sphingomonas sp. Leaf230]
MNHLAFIIWHNEVMNKNANPAAVHNHDGDMFSFNEIYHRPVGIFAMEIGAPRNIVNTEYRWTASFTHISSRKVRLASGNVKRIA